MKKIRDLLRRLEAVVAPPAWKAHLARRAAIHAQLEEMLANPGRPAVRELEPGEHERGRARDPDLAAALDKLLQAGLKGDEG